jgi:threonine synthase
VWVKNDAANPTHSFKDRVVSVASACARDLGFEVLACASTGNLANAVAAQAAALGMQSFVFIPSNLEEQKILATGVYGTNVVAVNGNYDDVNRLCTELSGEHESWAFVNVNLRPYYAEGSKTLAYEIGEQLGWTTPDRIVIPIASGLAVHEARQGLRRVARARPDPWLAPDVQRRAGRGCNPVAHAWEQGRDFCQPVKPDTIAKSLAIGNPADGPYALDVAKRTGGSIEQVTDDEIRRGIHLLAETTGVFTETAGGVTTAGAREARRAGRDRSGGARRARHHGGRPQDPRRGPRLLRGPHHRADFEAFSATGVRAALRAPGAGR